MTASPKRSNSHKESAGDPAPATRDAEAGAVAAASWIRVLDGLSDACMVSDANGRVHYANESARDLLHLRGRVSGRRVTHVLADRRALALLDEALASGRPRTAILALTFSSDGTRNYELSAVPVRETAGGVVLLRIALRRHDIPVAYSVAPPEDFSSSSEEIRQLGDPLTIIQGYLENLLDGVIRDPVVMRQCLAAMQRQAAQIQRILGGFRK